MSFSSPVHTGFGDILNKYPTSHHEIKNNLLPYNGTKILFIIWFNANKSSDYISTRDYFLER